MNPTPPKVQAPPPPECVFTILTRHGVHSDQLERALLRYMTEWRSREVAPSPAPASEGRSEETEAGDDMTARVPTGEFIAGFPRFGTLPEAAQVLAERIAKHYPCDDDCWQGRVGADAELILGFAETYHSVLSKSSTKSVSVAAHYPGAGVDSKCETLVEQDQKLLAKCDAYGASYYHDRDAARRIRELLAENASLKAAMAQSAGRDDGRGGKAE